MLLKSGIVSYRCFWQVLMSILCLVLHIFCVTVCICRKTAIKYLAFFATSSVVFWWRQVSNPDHAWKVSQFLTYVPGTHIDWEWDENATKYGYWKKFTVVRGFQNIFPVIIVAFSTSCIQKLLCPYMLIIFQLLCSEYENCACVRNRFLVKLGLP